ncbi:hypothetical protein INT44_002647 [Umbelopsis vinacea]|uniref:F-box domain-containing protein n=1 Tax=Umbelopsis vinacea TaxID=44442 RepID=A0A8H7PET8_9FUNG|nr:hypothetical protein INT44_002647 [Umbelopsis vinacea]
MNRPLYLPKELLELVFEELDRSDLVSCSYTSWFWNDSANVILYREIHGMTLDGVYDLIRTLELNQFENGPDISLTKRRRKLGSLVKVVRKAEELGEPEEFSFIIRGTLAYLLQTKDLSELTPNVHTAEMYETATASRDVFALPPNLWDVLEYQWKHLRRLTITHFKERAPWRIRDSFLDILLQLDYLDILDTTKFLSCDFPSAPVTPNLSSLKVSIRDYIQYDHVMTMLQSCQRTLHSLAIQVLPPGCIIIPFSFDNLLKKQLNLKELALTYDETSQLTISSFGDQIEVLEVIGNRQGNQQVEEEIAKAMLKASKLNTLSLGTCSYFTEYIPEFIDRNKATLHSLYLTSDVGDELIDFMIEDNLRADQVTTLCFECRYLDNSMVQRLAEIFPSIKYLGLGRGKAKSERKWITHQSLSRFRNLVGVDMWTFRELLDPNSYHGSKYKIRRPLMLKSSRSSDYSM